MIDTSELRELRAFAADAARAAGDVTLEYFGERVAVDRKSDTSPVTIADREAEEVLRRRLAIHCPKDAVEGEEFGVEEGSTGRRWTLDPIDGTRSFIRGVPLYGVLVGLLDGETAMIGVIHFPVLDETLAAATGLGCVWSRADEAETPARVSEPRPLREALVLATDFSRLPGRESGNTFARVSRAAGEIRTWGDCYGHALVATGRAEAMIDALMNPWDSVPLQPVIEEAGGRFTTLSGEAIPAGGSAVSSNGTFHRELLALLDESDSG